MDQQIKSNVIASNIIATSLKLRNQLALVLGRERASIISTTFCKLDKEEKRRVINYLTDSV